VTLIAAFRCDAGGHPAVVFCADSQETVDNAYRVEVKKIKPRDAGEYELIVGGSGYIGPLIDGQADAIEQSVKHWPAGLDEEKARLRLEQVLIGYNARHVKHYPVEVPKDCPEFKVMRSLVCLRDKITSQIYLWKTNATTAARVEDWELLGWEEAAYLYEVEWLYYPLMPAAQAMLLGLHLFTVAQNSLYIGGPTQAIVVNESGMHVQDPADISELEGRIKTFNRSLAQLFLACPDVSIHNDEFRGLLANFEDGVMRLREHYLEQTAIALLDRTANDPNYTGDAFPQVPPGTMLARGPDGELTIMKPAETRAFLDLLRRADGEPPPDEDEDESDEQD
jgi:hypothetical protein